MFNSTNEVALAVEAHAYKYYNDPMTRWDIWIETMNSYDQDEVLQGATTVPAAIAKAQNYLKLFS